jgi:diacylglycerol kinase family enzyme
LVAKNSTRFEVDGELAGHLPAQLGIIPSGLRILVP